MSSGLSRSARRRYVLDTNALTGFFEGRRGAADKVRHLLGEALRHDEPLLMSAVNWGEVFYIALRRHGEVTARDVDAKLQELPIAVIAVDRGELPAAELSKRNMAWATRTLLPPSRPWSEERGWSRPIPSFPKPGKHYPFIHSRGMRGRVEKRHT